MSEILKPETVTAREAQEARAHKLLRRQFADGYLRALLSNSHVTQGTPPSGDDAPDLMVDEALALADVLIAKTGGPG